MSLRTLVENKSELDYKALTSSLIAEFGITDTINWDAVIPANVQHSIFGGETLRLFEDHPNFSSQKDIRTILLKKGDTSQILILFAVLKDEKLSKSNIEKVTKKFIGGSSVERFVVWFLGNPSNTQFKVVLSGKEGKKTVLKTLPFGIDQPYYKTYDYILDEVHKKVSQLFVEPNELWKALWKAFDISVVNKRFYEDIKKSFEALISDGSLKGAVRNEETRKQFTVRLIGRIIFCWFLKKKNIITEDVFSSKAVDRYENYYIDFLERLFFDVFNTPQRERKKLPDEIKDYPFLNGGLFEDQPEDFKGKLILPNDWFSDLIKGTLEKYNFTIDENTSSSSEIAIDPEMLGRIFENLLAEHNPQTHETARKATGSYYTPREIVDYMVEQSITEYLKSDGELNVLDSELIDDFVNSEEMPIVFFPFAFQLLEKLNSVKVLDPACGSGAFPIGMLQKLIALKLQLLMAIKEQKSFSIYELKLQTILNSIYGCDIQPMAVELSRLRCWLSLIIDEPVDKKKPNWGIAYLPNLDFKFVCVNSLIGLPSLDSLGASENDFETLKLLRAEFFTASANRKLKIEKEFEELQHVIAERHREWATKNSQAVSMLMNWKPFKIKKTDWFDPFWMFGIEIGFDIVIGNPPYIGEKGNKELFHDVKYTSLGVRFYQRLMDYFYFFFHLGIDVLKPNGVLSFISTNYYPTAKGATNFRKDLKNRTVLNNLINFNELRIFESALGQHNLITILRKSEDKDFNCNIAFTNRVGYKTGEVINDILFRRDTETIYTTILQKDLYDGSDNYIRFYRSKESSELNTTIIKKILKGNYQLSNYSYISAGIQTGADRTTQKHFENKLIPVKYIHKGIFVLTDEELKELKVSKEEQRIIKPFFKNSDIDHFIANSKPSKFIIYATRDINITDYPNIHKHFKIYESILKSRSVDNGEVQAAYNLGKWWVISKAKKAVNFDGEKIVVPHRSKTNSFGYSNSPWYASADVYYIQSISNKLNIKYLLAILNSRLIYYWLCHKGKKKGDILELYAQPVSAIPIKVITNQVKFIELVDLIIESLKNKNGEVYKKLYNKLNIMIYRLYELTYEEVEVIDPKIEEIISEKDYDNYKYI